MVETGGRLASTETISDSERQAGSKFSVCRSARSDVQLRPHPQTSPNSVGEVSKKSMYYDEDEDDDGDDGERKKMMMVMMMMTSRGIRR